MKKLNLIATICFATLLVSNLWSQNPVRTNFPNRPAFERALDRDNEDLCRPNPDNCNRPQVPKTNIADGACAPEYYREITVGACDARTNRQKVEIKYVSKEPFTQDGKAKCLTTIDIMTIYNICSTSGASTSTSTFSDYDSLENNRQDYMRVCERNPTNCSTSDALMGNDVLGACSQPLYYKTITRYPCVNGVQRVETQYVFKKDIIGRDGRAYCQTISFICLDKAVPCPITSKGTYGKKDDEDNSDLDPDSNVNNSVYPNPVVNGSGVIAYSLGEKANIVTLEIVDVTGRVVYSANDMDSSEGSHEYTLNLSNVSNGIYFSRLNIDGRLYQNKISINRGQ